MARPSYHKPGRKRKKPVAKRRPISDRQRRCSRHRQCLAVTCEQCERRKRRQLVQEIYHAWIHTYGQGWVMLVTMTYLPDARLTPADWLDIHRRHWDALRKRWEREKGVPPALWSLEWTAFGTPHKHLAIPMQKGINLVELRMWLSNAWAAIAGDQVGDVHIAVGRGPGNIRRVIDYVLKDVREPGPDMDAGQIALDEPGPGSAKSSSAEAGVTPELLDGLITNDVLSAVERTLQSAYRPRPEGLPKYRRWDRMGGMPRGIIRRRREFIGSDGQVFNWHTYRRVSRQARYWMEKAIERPGSSKATTRALRLSAELAEMRERKPPPGGWRKQGDALDARTMQMPSGELVALYQPRQGDTEAVA